MKENRIPKTVSYMNVETKRLRGKPRNRGHIEVRKNGIIMGAER
jgi:hypothetical protein